MYLYLGQETVINTKDVVGIFDLENTTLSRLTKTYLAMAEKSGQVVAISQDIPKSFVVCEEMGRITVYLSQISPATLRKRSSYTRYLAGL